MQPWGTAVAGTRDNSNFRRRGEAARQHKGQQPNPKESRGRLLLCFAVEGCTQHAHHDDAKDDAGDGQHLALVHLLALCGQQRHS